MCDKLQLFLNRAQVPMWFGSQLENVKHFLRHWIIDSFKEMHEENITQYTTHLGVSSLEGFAQSFLCCTWKCFMGYLKYCEKWLFLIFRFLNWKTKLYLVRFLQYSSDISSVTHLICVRQERHVNTLLWLAHVQCLKWAAHYINTLYFAISSAVTRE